MVVLVEEGKGVHWFDSFSFLCSSQSLAGGHLEGGGLHREKKEGWEVAIMVVLLDKRK
jgi:hypothetical protein